MIINKNSNTQTTKNFVEKEFYSKSFNAPASHYLNELLPSALQVIREYFGVPIKVTSTFRTLSHNTIIGASTRSQHLTGEALDFQFIQNNEHLITLFNEQIETQGVLFQELRSFGINGFGIYDNFIHIDCRLNEEEPTGREYNNSSQHGGSFAFWNNSKKKVYESPLAFIRSFFSEDGLIGSQKVFITMLVVFFFPYLSYKILKK